MLVGVLHVKIVQVMIRTRSSLMGSCIYKQAGGKTIYFFGFENILVSCGFSQHLN